MSDVTLKVNEPTFGEVFNTLAGTENAIQGIGIDRAWHCDRH
jgi:hypothetical protein